MHAPCDRSHVTLHARTSFNSQNLHDHKNYLLQQPDLVLFLADGRGCLQLRDSDLRGVPRVADGMQPFHHLVRTCLLISVH